MAMHRAPCAAARSTTQGSPSRCAPWSARWPSRPPRSPTRTSRRRRQRASWRSRSSRSWSAPRSARRRGSMTRRSRPSHRRPRTVTMRLAILDSGHGLGTKALFAFVRGVSRQPVPEILKLIRYRPDFFGAPMQKVVHEAMRGPSAWSVGDRELMAAFVSKVNECEFCTKAHAAVAAGAYRDDAKVAAVLADLETAAIEETLRATLRMLGKLTREHTVGPDDMRVLLASGVSRKQIEDALAVCFSFNTIGRLADAF